MRRRTMVPAPTRISGTSMAIARIASSATGVRKVSSITGRPPTALAGRDLLIQPATYRERAALVGCVWLTLDSVLSPRAVNTALATQRV